MTIVKDVWQQRDNHFSLLLEATEPGGNREPADSTQVTRVMLELEEGPSLTVDRDEVDAMINWWDVALDPGEFRFQLGDFATFASPGAYAARLTLYSLSSPDGVVWASFARQELRMSIHSTEQEVVPANVVNIK